MSIVTVAPMGGRTPGSAGSGQPHGRLARRAVAVSLVSGAMIATALLISGICAAAGIDTAGVGMLVALGVPGALVALVLAIVARAHGERWGLLWLPFAVFPATVLSLLVAMLLLWE